MTSNSFDGSQEQQDFVKYKSQQSNHQIAQERLYSYLIEIVQKCPPDEVLNEFKRLFIDFLDSVSLGKSTGIYGISFLRSEKEFYHTIKRCFYIIVNNWEAQRKYKYIQKIIKLFESSKNSVYSNHPQTKVFQGWLKNFVESKDYKDLKNLAYKYKKQAQKYEGNSNWSNRYTSYLLVAQSFDAKRPREQQEVARKLSRQMKDKFKFELAMYVARSQSANSSNKRYKNPTILGDNVLRLIKTIVVKKGVFSYENLANIFINQTANQTLKDFKESIKKYLFFTVDNQELINNVRKYFSEKLDNWKSDANEEIINNNLILRTCNRIIDCITIETGKEPSPLFILLLSGGNPLTLVIVLLKIILISRNSRSHLEIRIAHLISYYENYPEEECKWFINFLEFFNITFAIYAENVEYNLINMEKTQSSRNSQTLDDYRVFSQMRLDKSQ
ncbi:hypothetical protein H6G33_24285 [Calothrix sp. FACHB-1219]|uniref:hypothetical protein n=1 Tax=unclassified Calothrix TaxID=2619626 RepID=UPI001687AACA|nr:MULTISPECIES: hypothetical protein [unclassified Calothrix]MBD2205464.1 hypothetical protein [Calothrix sp. FACHB-168]MBD2220126.1 hypothetical protein [Calothrix sp. FACHB-1219]